jgi:hypothetical protein
VPNIWKKAKIIMILKKDKPPDEVSSYRPISLQNCIAKWLEKIINTKIQAWAEKEKVLPESQSGFRKKRSTQDHILRINQSIISGFNKKEITGAIFFDLEKAFDKTSHSGIIKKMKKHGLKTSFVNWIKSFLKSRTFQIFSNGSLSSTKRIRAGVPLPLSDHLYTLLQWHSQKSTTIRKNSTLRRRSLYMVHAQVKESHQKSASRSCK